MHLFAETSRCWRGRALAGVAGVWPVPVRRGRLRPFEPYRHEDALATGERTGQGCAQRTPEGLGLDAEHDGGREGDTAGAKPLPLAVFAQGGGTGWPRRTRLGERSD